MKFLKILAAVLALSLIFMTFGGYMLFDFNEHFWLASFSCGVLLSLLIYVLYRQDEKIDELKERLEKLEKAEEKESK